MHAVKIRIFCLRLPAPPSFEPDLADYQLRHVMAKQK
jgi:hypothetical protein